MASVAVGDDASSAPPLSARQRVIKRAFDLVVCCLLAAVAWPVMVTIAVAIKLDSPGPVLFKQRRVGAGGTLFTMYKFRSMLQEADNGPKQAAGQDPERLHVHKCPNHPRVTRVGRLLRRTSLDELPQLFNVLRGDMSLVGPRPELPWLVARYEAWQRERLAVPQGMTGWWQVSGRSERPMHLHTEDDLYYLAHYSFWLDLRILAKTIPIVLRGSGAY